MSTTNWLILDLKLPGNKQADGQLQLTYTITNNTLKAGATLHFRANSHSKESTIATTPKNANGASNGTSVDYAVPKFTVRDFDLPASGPYHGGKYDGVGFTLTIDDAGNGWLSNGVFVPDNKAKVKGDSDDDLSWSASDIPPRPAEAASKKGSGAY